MKVFASLLYLLYVLLKFLKFSTADTAAAMSGPYRSQVIRTQKCEKTTYPLEKDPPVAMALEVYNTTSKKFLLRGNITVSKENRQVKIKLKSFIWRNGKWKLTYFMNNVGCHGALLYMFVTAVGIDYNRETCGFVKGKYSFKDIDTDTIQHIWASKMEYGRILWTCETTTLSTTYNCWEFETLVESLD